MKDINTEKDTKRKYERCSSDTAKGFLFFVEARQMLGRGLFAEMIRSSVTAYICPACGHIELEADNPKQFKPL